MTGREKLYSIIYFMPLILLLSIYKPPQSRQIDIILADTTQATKAPEIIQQAQTAPALDIRTGRHETTNDERAIIKTNFLTRWDESHWPAFEQLIQNESGWTAGNINKSSGACGLGQALPCSKYIQGAELGDAINEANWAMDYILIRYKTPKNAYNFWLSKHPHWY